MSKILFLPVSLGEAIDKLTILDIKCAKIMDERKLDVEKEYTILYDELRVFIDKYKTLYDAMKRINLIIWNQMDVLRDGSTNDEDYMKLCKECIESNDIRFRIKNKINLISNSSLKEQKSYKIIRLVIHLNCHEHCLSLFIDYIKYFSYIYDEIIINSSKKIGEIKDIFQYDNTIKYNVDLNGLEIKKEYYFEERNYNLNDIYKITNISENQLKLI